MGPWRVECVPLVPAMWLGPGCWHLSAGSLEGCSHLATFSSLALKPACSSKPRPTWRGLPGGVMAGPSKRKTSPLVSSYPDTTAP